MIEPFEPSFTKKVPTIEVTMQTAQMASGYSMTLPRTAVPPKKIAPRTIVATTVTA